VRFEVLIELNIKIDFLGCDAACSLVDRYNFGEIFYPEVRRNNFLQNVGMYVPKYIASHS
jgi:hypothetical protein